MSTLAQLAGAFALLSLLAVGGGAAVLPEMKETVVGQHHWLTDTQFVHVYSLGQVAPGPPLETQIASAAHQRPVTATTLHERHD